jgi:hypothetical protein
MLTLSYLDVLCCCLGASALLFIALVSSRLNASGGPPALSRGEFIDVVAKVSDDKALFRLVVTTPRGNTIKLSEPQRKGSMFEIPGVEYGALRVIGADPATNPVVGAGESGHAYEVSIIDPSPGRWRLSVMYYDRIEPIELLRPSAAVRIEQHVATSFAASGRSFAAPVRFGESTCPGDSCVEVAVPTVAP